MSFADWLFVGIESGFCGPAVCSTHDGVPTTAEDDEEFELGGDPCVFVIRPYETAQEKIEVEANHSASTWRKDH